MSGGTTATATLFGTAAAAGAGTAAVGGAAGVGAGLAAATSGLIGTAGEFSLATTLGTLATGAAALSPILSGFAQSQTAGYQSAIARNNQIIAQQNATTALQQGQSQQQQEEMKTAAVVGSEKAAEAAGNIDVNSGSALDVRSSAAALGELSSLNIGYNAQTKANAFLASAATAGAQSSMYSAEQTPDLLAGFLNPNSSLIGSAQGLSSKWASIVA